MSDARKDHKMAAENKVGFLWHGKGSKFCHLLTTQVEFFFRVLVNIPQVVTKYLIRNN